MTYSLYQKSELGSPAVTDVLLAVEGDLRLNKLIYDLAYGSNINAPLSD